MRIEEGGAAENYGLPATATRRVLLGLGSTGLAQVVSAAYSLALTPLFLLAWGPDEYGRWLTLTALTAFLVLVDLGSQSYLGNLMAQAYVRQDIARFRQTLAEGLSLIGGLSISVFLLLVGGLLQPWYTFPALTRLSLDERIILLLLAANTLLGVSGGLFAGVYRATGYLAWGTMIGNIARLAGLLVMAALLLFRQPPIVLAGVVLATGIICTVGLAAGHPDKDRLFGGLNLGGYPALQGLRHFNGALHFWLISLASMLNTQGIVLILNAFVSPASIAVFSTTRAVTGLVTYVGSLLQAPIQPELTFLYAQNRQEDLRRYFLFLVKVVMLFAGLAALAGWIFLPMIYPLWTGRQLPLDRALLAILLIQAVLSLGWNSSGWVLLAINQHHRPAWWSLANAGVTLGLSWALAPSFGMIGVASASLAGDIACGLLVIPAFAGRLLNIPPREIYKAILLPVLVISGAGGVFSWLVDWRGPIVGGTAGGLAVAALAIYLLKVTFNPDEEAWLRGRIADSVKSGRTVFHNDHKNHHSWVDGRLRK